MSRFTFNLATPADDDQLGELLAATPMDGACPSHSRGSPAISTLLPSMGAPFRSAWRVTVPPAASSAWVRASIGLRYVNGERVPVGYLAGLRLAATSTGAGRGFWHADIVSCASCTTTGGPTYYFTTIAADNEVATVLTSKRAGLPVYHPCGRFHTLAISSSSIRTHYHVAPSWNRHSSGSH